MTSENLIENLRLVRPKARYEYAKDHFLMIGVVMREAADEIERLRRELAALRADAVETVQHWGCYASAYFQDKHNLEGDIERLRGSDTRND